MPDTDVSTLLDERIRIMPDVETIEGADGHPMLFSPATGVYVRLGRQAVRMVSMLDGSRSGWDVVRVVSAGNTAAEGAIADRFALMLHELRQAGLLDGVAAAPESGRQRVARSLGTTKVKRFVLTTAVRRPWRLTRLIQLLPLPLVGWTATAVCLLAGWLAALIAVRQGPPSSLWALPLALLVLVAQICCHESAHALVCQVLGVPPREAGVALWYYVIPIAYVDRTDTYRLRGRSGRVAVSLAGIGSDLLWACVAATVAANTGGLVRDTAVALLYLQFTMVVGTLNPLLPTDGQQAAEALLGELNLRGRAMAYLAHRVLRAPLPSYLLDLSRRRRAVYLFYGALCGLYLALVVAGLLWWLYVLSRLLLGAL